MLVPGILTRVACLQEPLHVGNVVKGIVNDVIMM